MVRGIWAKNFFHRENSFFWNVCSYRPLRSLRKNLSICTLIVNINCVPIQYVPWHFSWSIKRENLTQNFFFAGNAAFFFKILFSNNLLGPNKSFYRVHSVCHISMWTLKICPLRFFTSNNRRKSWPKTFVIVKTAVFWNVCSYRLLRSQRNYLIFCTIFVNIACVPIQDVPWHFSCSIKEQK